LFLIVFLFCKKIKNKSGGKLESPDCNLRLDNDIYKISHLKFGARIFGDIL